MASINPLATNTIGVIGTGTMGRGIAQLAAQSGMTVKLFDVRAGATDQAIHAINQNLQRLTARDKLSDPARQAILQHIHIVDSLDDMKDCTVVVEAIAEDLLAKQDLFQRLEAVVGPNTLLATNTSSLSVTAIAAACTRPQRVVGWHFFNPVPLMRLAEVIAGRHTDPGVVLQLADLTRAMGHSVVQAADMPGFIVNHAGRAYGPEALRIHGEGIASVEDIDGVMRDCAGFRMGPFELMDLIGLDVALSVMTTLYEQYLHEPRFRVTPWLARQVDAGLLGRKTERGFHSYRDGARILLPQPLVPQSPRFPVWISTAEADLAELVRQVLHQCGATIESGAHPSAKALIVVTPIGDDVTTTCARLGLDASRTVGVDALLSMEKRRSLMFAPPISNTYRDAAWAIFASDGTAVSILRDSPGFIGQRMIAQIVSIACDIAQQRIASPADIDRAVRLGLGYPLGPFELGNRVGASKILRILEALTSIYQEPRYRPSIWLRRRALLGLPLDTAD